MLSCRGPDETRSEESKFLRCPSKGQIAQLFGIPEKRLLGRSLPLHLGHVGLGNQQLTQVVNIGSKGKTERPNRVRGVATLALRRYDTGLVFPIHFQKAPRCHSKQRGTTALALAPECSESPFHSAVTHWDNSADRRKLRNTRSRFPKCTHSITELIRRTNIIDTKLQ
jgi:hypothetical protein